MKKYLELIFDIYNKVNVLQIRKSKYNVTDIFRTLIKSSFNDNSYSNFLGDYDLDLMFTGNFSYWVVKIYAIDFDNLYNANYNMAIENNFNTNYTNPCNLSSDFLLINVIFLILNMILNTYMINTLFLC